MIISKTPFRVSLFGGGTDYAAWYETHGGATLGFSIDKYCWISLRRLPPFFAYRHRLVYSSTELVSSVADIQHPVIRVALGLVGVPHGIELHHDGDLPARAGLGSSSAFTVGLLNVLHTFRGHSIGRKTLAEEAISVERDLLQENVGSQDQVWAAYGGLNEITFHRDGAFDVSPLLLPHQRCAALNDRLMLFFTGFSRHASAIAGQVVANFSAQEENLHRLQHMVVAARSLLESTASLYPLGEMLDETWRRKRELAPCVSTPEIDDIYREAKTAGATGGKLLGAGGGGFFLLFVPPDRQNDVRRRLAKLINVEFRIGREGSKIVLYEPGGL